MIFLLNYLHGCQVSRKDLQLLGLVTRHVRETRAYNMYATNFPVTYQNTQLQWFEPSFGFIGSLENN